jgi:hypothetical protein
MKLVTGVLPIVLAGCHNQASSGDWMLGVFSGGKPGPSFLGNVERYRIEEGNDATYELVDANGIRYSRARTWEQEGANAIMIFPGPDDEDSLQDESWKITRAGRCGPYEFDSYVDGKDQIPDSSGEIYRGELCSRPRTEPCMGECDCCELYWCEPPPPCD